MPRRRAAALVSGALTGVALLAGCSEATPTGIPGTSPTRPGTSPTGSASAVAKPPCPPSADYPISSDSGDREAPGVGNGVTLWALFFPREGERELRATKETKIVWRMTGTGDLRIRAVGPGDATVAPTWGPEGHTGSIWSRPGDEWGTGWVFPTAGCWTVQADRDNGATALLTLRVAP
ncbi:hypothetical protein ACWDV4_26420 [Micromonospora sp. NPDC003197]